MKKGLGYISHMKMDKKVWGFESFSNPEPSPIG
jgi:hypothetical protein